MQKWSLSTINFNPDESVSEKYRAFQGCPTIATTKGGRLFAGWYTGGIIEPDQRNFNVLVMSDDNGEGWSKPLVTIHTDYEKCIRAIDIQLWVDPRGRLWVMWTNSEYKDGTRFPRYNDTGEFLLSNFFGTKFGVWAMICDDPDDHELVWSEPRWLSDGFLRCKPVTLRSGKYIFPAYDWVHEQNYMLRFSDDEGETFYDVAAARKPQNKVFDETMIMELKDGTLRLVARTNLGYYAISHSQDEGKNWGETTEWMKAPSTRLYTGRLQSGHVILVRSIADNARTGMKIMLSEDDGATFPYEIALDTRGNLSYPDVSEDGDGSIFIIYDRERDNRIGADPQQGRSSAAKQILLSKLTESDIRNGSLSGNSYTAKVISQGEDHSYSL